MATIESSVQEMISSTGAETSSAGPSFQYTQPPAAQAEKQYIKFLITHLSSHILKITISVDAYLVNILKDQIIELFQSRSFDGFETSNAPAEYVSETYPQEILQNTKDHLLRHIVVDFLLNEISTRKITATNFPRLDDITQTEDGTMDFCFDVSVADLIELKEWKNFAFKPPKRKKYKDLDKQVVSFVENRNENSKKASLLCVDECDWVLLEATLLNKEGIIVSTHHSGLFWLKIDHHDANEPFIQSLMGKETGYSFISSHFRLCEQNNDIVGQELRFLINIKSLVKNAYFSLELFKTMFKLKNKQDIHNKVIEVFSYRNDISQRKAIVEEVFHLLLSKHRFEVPKHLILRRQEDILKTLSTQPDYHVYKAQKEFCSHIENLAEKQLKEEIIIDQIAYAENIKTDVRDMVCYLHLCTNRRLHEFIYFNPVFEIASDFGYLVNYSVLSQAAFREKTLNYIIHTLTR